MSQEMLESLRQAGLGRVAEPIADLARPSIEAITTRLADEYTLPVGATRFGGRPDLMPGVEWPTWEEGPLDFLVQIHLPDLATYELDVEIPDSGWLLFFYDSCSDSWGDVLSEKGSWRVLYQEGKAADLTRTSMPMTDEWVEQYGEDRSEGYYPCSVEFRREMTLPSVHSIGIMHALGLTENERRAYARFVDEFLTIDELAERIGRLGKGGHRLSGHHRPVQLCEMEYFSELLSRGIRPEELTGQLDELAEARRRATDWRFLLQLKSDENMGSNFVDEGGLYFWARGRDMLDRRFDRAWMILQSF